MCDNYLIRKVALGDAENLAYIQTESWKAAFKDMPGYAELICIHSLPDKWGKGYGSKMMDKVLADIKNVGYKKVMLWVFEENMRARTFYEAKGFIKDEKSKTIKGVTEVMYVLEM